MKLLGVLQKFLFLLLLVLFPLIFWVMFVRLSVFLPALETAAPKEATTTVGIMAGSGVKDPDAGSTIEHDILAGKSMPIKTEATPKTVNTPAIKELAKLPQNQISGNGALTRQGIIEQTNEQRQSYLGVGYSLKENTQLNAAAAAKVKDMFDGQYFEHVSPAGNGPAYFVGLSGYEYIAIGENLAMGTYKNDADVVQAWMESPGHRENILKAGYEEIGVAVGYGNFSGKKIWLAVQEFGVPRSACPEIDASLSKLIDANKTQLDRLSVEQKNLYESISRQKENIKARQEELAVLAGQWKSNNELEEKKAELERAVDAVNDDINKYNSMNTETESIYNIYKARIDQYNLKVNAFNNCMEALN